jgi:hypothetical protein
MKHKENFTLVRYYCVNIQQLDPHGSVGYGHSNIRTILGSFSTSFNIASLVMATLNKILISRVAAWKELRLKQ